MNTDTAEEKLIAMTLEPATDEINLHTEKIIQCCYAVANTLGAGFLEKVYENALAVEFSRQNIPFRQQAGLTVSYQGVSVGEYIADFVVAEKVVLEIKALNGLDEAHRAQVINYLRAANLKAGLLINFGRPKIEIRRVLN